MRLVAVCPKCGVKLTSRKALAGSDVACPKCKNLIPVAFFREDGGAGPDAADVNQEDAERLRQSVEQEDIARLRQDAGVDPFKETPEWVTGRRSDGRVWLAETGPTWEEHVLRGIAVATLILGVIGGLVMVAEQEIAGGVGVALAGVVTAVFYSALAQILEYLRRVADAVPYLRQIADAVQKK